MIAGFGPSSNVNANCSGEAVEVKRLGEGRYVVKFIDNPAGIAVATSNVDHEGGTPIPSQALDEPVFVPRVSGLEHDHAPARGAD